MTTGCEKSSKFVMASSSSSSQSSSRPLKEWTVKELTEYLRERGVSTSGYNKEKLVKLATAVADLDLPVDPDLSRADTGRSLQEKLARAGCSFTDPTKLAGFTSNFENIPDFGLFDIFNYLILNRTDYDRKKLKGYKSFEDYRLFADGNVVSLQFNEVSSSSSVCVFLAEVRPTQKDRTYLNKSSYQTWVVMNKTTGEINVAFCECQGGSDGGCRHVGAVLYEIEAFNVKSCTDGPAVWKRKPRQHDIATVLTNLTVKKARYGDSSSGSTSALALKKVEFDPRSVGDRGPLNDSEIADFTSGLVKADLSAAAIEFYDVELQQEEPSSFAYDHLMVSNQVAKITSTSDNTLTPSEVAEKMVMTEEEIQDVEEHTRGQAGNQIWHDLRKCRLTASNFKAIASSKKEDGGSLAIRIMDGGALEFEPAAIEWGRKKEKVAVEYYSRVRRQSHRQHQMTQSGLCLLPQKSYIGASPDGIATCKCTSCPDKLVEVKCPFSERESHPKDAARKRGCSDGPDGELTMDSSCQYFAQIQGQMGVCGINQCDLVVYTKKGICVVPVKFDEQYFSDMVSKLEMYFIKIVLPKLLA